MARGKRRKKRGATAKKKTAPTGNAANVVDGAEDDAAATKTDRHSDDERSGEVSAEDREDSEVEEEEEEEEELTTEQQIRRDAARRRREEKERKRRARAEKARRKAELAMLGGPTKVRLRHILVKHTESRNCFSKRTMHEVQTTRAEALEELEEMLATLKQTENSEDMTAKFIEFASIRSDCSTHKDGGDMGLFPRGNMHPLFDKVAFGLQIGELADQIVETDSGCHLLLRIA